MMTRLEDEGTVRTRDDLHGRYEEPVELVMLKQIDRLDEHCRQFIDAAPFLVLATSGPAGVDCSPKGGEPGFVAVLDSETLLIPDHAGNNRIDSLGNIVENPKAGGIFFIPGCPEALRVGGTAVVSLRPDLLARFSGDGRPPKSVIVMHVEEAFLHCGRAIRLADLWNPDKMPAREQLPDLGAALKAHVRYSRNKRSSADGAAGEGPAEERQAE